MITLMMPYYNSPKMLQYHFKYWNEYPDEVAQKVTVIIVDDGSPDYPLLDIVKTNDISGFADFQAYRIKQNLFLNTVGAKNLGAHVAGDGWLFSTDMDHVVPAYSMAKLLEHGPCLDPAFYYSVSRMRLLPNGEYAHEEPHRDTFVLTKDLYWKSGGLDEDFSGWYGGASRLFIKRLDMISARKILEDVYHVFVGLNIVPDAHGSLRDQREWKKRDYKKNRTLKNRVANLAGEYVPKDPLRFDWERII